MSRALETGSNMIFFHKGSFLPVLEKIIGPNYWEVAEPIFDLLRNQEHLTFVPLNAFMSRPNDKHMGIAGTFCPRN